MKKKIPTFKSDKEAETFVDEADLTEYDLSGFKRVNFEIQNKNAKLNMRLPQSQLDAIKKEAEKRGVPYQRLVRELIQIGMEELNKEAA